MRTACIKVCTNMSITINSYSRSLGLFPRETHQVPTGTCQLMSANVRNVAVTCSKLASHKTWKTWAFTHANPIGQDKYTVKDFALTYHLDTKIYRKSTMHIRIPFHTSHFTPGGVSNAKCHRHQISGPFTMNAKHHRLV